MLPVPIRIPQCVLRGVLPTLLALGLVGLATHPTFAEEPGLVQQRDPVVVAQTSEAQVQALLEEARQHLAADRASQALAVLEQAYQLDPNNVAVTRLRSEAMAKAEQQAADDPATRIDTLNRAGQAHLDALEYDKAAATYREVLTLDGSNRDARRGLERADRELARANTERAKVLLDGASANMAAGNYDAARAQIAEAQAIDPSNRAATRLSEDLEKRASTGAENQVAPAAPAEPRPVLVAPSTGESELSPASALSREDRSRTREADRIFREGLAIFEQRERSIANLEQARQLWTEALTVDPTFERARVYLENTAAEFAELVAEGQRSASFAAREADALARMRTLIPIQTSEPTPLRDLLNLIKPLSGIDFVIAGGVNARVEASFTDRPLNEVLDAILLPNGLRWERTPGSDVVIITPDLRTRIFPLTREGLAKAEGLLEDGTLQSLMYGPGGTPMMDGQRLFTDRRQDALVITDSQANIDKLEALLRGLRDRESVDLVFASYRIQEDKGPQIKALLEAILRRDDTAPFNPDRRLILEGRELIIRDTPENIREVERILNDREFLAKIYEDRLDVGTFNLTPILDIQDNPDLARRFGADVRQVVETLLYSQEGIAAAAAQGRRLWYDEATLQLTITDTPDRLNQVSQFIQSLPQIQRERRSKIRALNWASAADLVAEIRAFLGIDTGATGGGGGRGNEVVRTVRQGQEFQFQGTFFRVVRIEENDSNDPNDDEVTVLARSNVQSDEITIAIFRAEEILNGEFTIVAEDIRPGNRPGDGRARLRVVFQPLAAEAGLQNFQVQQEVVQQEQRAPTFDILIEPIINLNSVWIQYTDAAELAEVEFWIDRLDVPTLQVSMEVKFVEVIENKARQLKADFNITDLTEGFDLSDSVANGRFAQDVDEYNTPFEPFTEGLMSANLLKGASVTSWIINNGNSPISFTLRALEAQGIINIVNAPSLTVLNGETGNFSIGRSIVAPGTSGTFRSGGQNSQDEDEEEDDEEDDDEEDDEDDGGGEGDTADVSRGPFTDTAQQFGSRGGIIYMVDNLEVTPIVTQAGNITLSPIDVIIQDFENNAGSMDILFNQSRGASTPTSIPFQRAVFNVGGYTILEKDISTHARIRDGGTVVLGGWKNERTEKLDSQTPVLGDIPYVGKLLFSRMQETQDRVTLLIFLTGAVVRD
jgi:type II secretory pathway component GspD/PulD (secretin)